MNIILKILFKPSEGISDILGKYKNTKLAIVLFLILFFLLALDGYLFGTLYKSILIISTYLVGFLITIISYVNISKYMGPRGDVKKIIIVFLLGRILMEIYFKFSLFFFTDKEYNWTVFLVILISIGVEIWYLILVSSGLLTFSKIPRTKIIFSIIASHIIGVSLANITFNLIEKNLL